MPFGYGRYFQHRCQGDSPQRLAQQRRLPSTWPECRVSGFSGAPPPVQIAPGVDPNQKTFIDLNGPSLRCRSSHKGDRLRRSLSAHLNPSLSAPRNLAAFSVALDDKQPANIFAAASSAYGLPIVAPGLTANRSTSAGAPNASFMPDTRPAGRAGFDLETTATGAVVCSRPWLPTGANSGAALGAPPTILRRNALRRRSRAASCIASGRTAAIRQLLRSRRDRTPRACRLCHGRHSSRSTLPVPNSRGQPAT